MNKSQKPYSTVKCLGQSQILNQQPSDPMYGKVYLRGNFYNFTPALINEYMGTSPREEEVEVTSEQVAQELTAGNGPLVNWMPSLNENTAKWSLAELLYKVGKGIKINFGEMVLSQIMNVVESGMPKASLVFPNLIHTLLVQQKFKLQKPMVPVKPLSISVKLRRGTHQNDLKTTTPKENPTDKTTLLKYFQKRLTEIEQEESWISKRHLELKEEKSEVRQWVKALTKNTVRANSQEGNQDEEEEEKTPEENVETSVSTSSENF
ncbi:uncharacterized protein LOC116003957 [Ipomoea triloba]|uniref:uncharacterized protein LOC116003957 n=1 Tax=Ipomoea triloba TaxID=35885 RepID=UPI00125E9787|nr:uncharacterized protein LOC116003957 [Ipomoea triloba]